MRRCLLLLLLCACSRGSPRQAVIDEKLMVALEEARAWQHRADLHQAGGDPAAAVADVEQVMRISFPAGAEGEEARLDGWARLAQLHVAQGDADRALADLERGRAEATHDSFYRAHLETVAGEIFEARAAGASPELAKRARQDALDAYARSIAISQRVQARLAKEHK
jgi:tetratricopeptide (TPR) repeat protein